jgi:SAM-dependent methyltransferase
MSEPNYESQWWGYIYDQMMAEMPETVETTLRFYRNHLRGTTGPVLECACGTGLSLLPLLTGGYDMYGFDISRSMLNTLTGKAAQQGIGDIDARISAQDLETFRYDRQFDAITIPSNTFSMMSTQESQLRALRNIFAHLAPSGRLLLDFRLAGVQSLTDNNQTIYGTWYTWTHPETGRPIRQRIIGRIDFNMQQILDQCYIEYDDIAVDFPMTARWIFKDEFTLLLQLAGFTRWAYFGTPDGEELNLGPEDQHSYWVVEKAGALERY